MRANGGGEIGVISRPGQLKVMRSRWTTAIGKVQRDGQPPPQGLKGEVVSLTDPRPDGTGVLGPGPGLEKFKGTRNLRVIGKICFRDSTKKGVENMGIII